MIPLNFNLKELKEIEKDYLEEITYAKIAEADMIYVVNCNNYIGETVRKEINWAAQLCKKIQYSEKGDNK